MKRVSPKKAQPGELHPRNKHHGRYDMPALVKALPALKAKIILNPKGEQTVNFAEADSVLLLNRALLALHYQVANWAIPKGYLCPPIPGRADYVHYMADILGKREDRVRVLDIGTGASCIYPIIGVSDYGWQFTASDIDPVSIKVAKETVQQNATLIGKVECRLQEDAQCYFKGIIQEGEFYHITLCNPPFHKSLQEAQKGTERKAKNLAHNRRKKGQKGPTIADGLNFGGQKAELWCKGGEQAFIINMAKESIEYKDQVEWFSTLVSKKENVLPMKKALDMLGATTIKVVEMAQGQKVSRLIAWKFR
jgi:23S rRNA (adenine1618-N6)-methyltransferase